ncbi:MAG: cell division protein FtsZ, partial [Deltaproteobacteria bacterium]|nr:cell division protein FtsZ [Deltaproteobacteria bacterium]
RIYEEVGEDADIIWGTVVDESLGDEMRVTVIATGIGTVHESSVSKKCINKHIDHELRGKIRDITPDDMRNAVDFDEPTFIRRNEAVGESTGATYRGYKGIVIDNNDLEIPTFLRRKAD